ncbi:hypothetical protein, partial [Marinobacter mobilis]
MVIPINNSFTLATTSGGYYGLGAYRPESIPSQQDQRGDANRSTLGRTGSIRLPWGNAQDVAPASILSRVPPKSLRRIEREGDPLAGVGYQGRMDHECIRHARMAFRVIAVDFVGILSKFAFFTLGPLSIVVSLLFYFTFGNDPYLIDSKKDLFIFVAICTILPLAVWQLTKIMFNLFPKWLLKTGRGPEWELNRRTGLVTVWTYPKKAPFRKQGNPTITQAPFYEFDAWVNARADRHGVLNSLVMYHRYQKLMVPVGDLLGNQSLPQPCYA